MDNAIARLKRLDACAVSDAMDKLRLTGAVSGLARRATEQCIAGRVVTYRMVDATAASHPSLAAPRHLGTTAVEVAEAGQIVVAEQRTGLDAASWGGILSLGAKLRRIAGVIIEGPVRDIDEARGYGFPVFARSVTTRTARGRIVEEFTNRPIVVGDVTVTPGDYAIADGSGAVFVRAIDIGRVLDAAEMIAGREAAMAKALLRGQSIGDVMAADYEQLLQ